MRKRNYEWDDDSRLRARGSGLGAVRNGSSSTAQSPQPTARHGFPLVFTVTVALTGCAAPEYTVRDAPVPDESAAAVRIERTISAYQAQEFDRQGARVIGAEERLGGVAVPRIVERLSRVTERPSLHYRAFLYQDRDPNAAALADGRIYLSTGMLEYLERRGSRPDELAFVLSHELAHTVAQHLVKRYRILQRQQLLMALVAAGTAAATRDAGSPTQQAGRLAMDVAALMNDVALSGYSQEQELEADQLGIRYLIAAGFNPQAALDVLEDFSRFDEPWPFLRTHPYSATRREHLQQYLNEMGLPAPPRQAGPPAAAPSSPGAEDERVRRLRATQRLYPVGSISWKNLQRQIEALTQ